MVLRRLDHRSIDPSCHFFSEDFVRLAAELAMRDVYDSMYTINNGECIQKHPSFTMSMTLGCYCYEVKINP
jgi:hypothetical protein